MPSQSNRRFQGACSIAPMLSVRNGARAVEFYKSAFGAIEVFRMEDPGGAVVSRLSVEGAEFWLATNRLSMATSVQNRWAVVPFA